MQAIKMPVPIVSKDSFLKQVDKESQWGNHPPHVYLETTIFQVNMGWPLTRSCSGGVDIT